MVNFEDGELVKGAYVVIDGKEYEVHMPQYSGKTPLSSENLNKMQVEILKTMLPVGSRYVTQDNTNPSEILGFGTWERLKGKVCLGLDENDADFNEIWKTGGEKTHKLKEDELPKFNRVLLGVGSGYLLDASNATAGAGQVGANEIEVGKAQEHNNLQPYEVVGYMWIRRL